MLVRACLAKLGFQGKIDWTRIGRELGRQPKDCQDKWRLILASKMKKGPFTLEEDALIRRRVEEWGDKGRGLWVSLQEEMGRRAFLIQHRWNGTLSRKDC